MLTDVKFDDQEKMMTGRTLRSPLIWLSYIEVACLDDLSIGVSKEGEEHGDQHQDQPDEREVSQGPEVRFREGGNENRRANKRQGNNRMVGW